MTDTFVAKRYHLPHRAYVDSKNKKLSERFPKWLGDPIKPPKDGSSPFLSLPTELRLQVYSYLTRNGGQHLDDFKRSFNLPTSSSPSTTFAYLYRSPGRLTKPHSISKQVIDLFHVCHQMRDELIDACFSDRTFVLEASLYQRDAGGLFVLPANPNWPTAWVKKLVLLTTIESHGFVKGITDLRPLQQMTNLRVLYLGFKLTNVCGTCWQNLFHRPDNILKAIIECVPKDTEVHIASDSTMSGQVFANIKSFTYGTSLENKDVDTLATFRGKLAVDAHRKGRLSGSLVNHSLCEYRACQEGLDCVNSQCRVFIKETKRSRVRSISDVEFERIKKQQEVDEATAAIQFRQTSKVGNIDAKRCVHGHTQCDECENGLVQRWKRWSGWMFGSRTDFGT